jgi:uncharacterized membrane protein YgdD (TMEM256/DUF423 family)
MHSASIRQPVRAMPPNGDAMRQPVTIADRWAAWLVGAAGASAVLLGAFGAHALHSVLDADGRELWHTASQYHFWHALALAVASLAAAGRARRWALIALALGIVLFCGSLYALALGAPRGLGAITPLGGLAFIIGWVALGRALWRTRGGAS